MRVPSSPNQGWRARRATGALALLLLAPPPETAAQQVARTPRVGVLFLTSPSSAAGGTGIEALRASLRELGHVEGRTVTIEYRSAEGRAERLPELAAQLVERKVDVIVTGGGNVSTLAARKEDDSHRHDGELEGGGSSPSRQPGPAGGEHHGTDHAAGAGSEADRIAP